MSIELESNSNLFPKTADWLSRLQAGDFFDSLEMYGEMGVQSLAENTPIDTGETAASWSYTVTRSDTLTEIQWTNSEVVAGTPLVILLQYGHGTGTGGYVQGRDFINPAMAPVFIEILNEVRKEITR